ncbi:Nitrate/nitrite sensor protein NarX [Corynebacterium gerontici]|uniref:histidine kinase n=2 Tax=Corynebacterium gerontici TaxID=2079234 RepID=A0A3G6J5G7_9CORY|nr:Nitrate/nitrite sensor protein NarX [Corynebacterium gerontici]
MPALRSRSVWRLLILFVIALSTLLAVTSSRQPGQPLWHQIVAICGIAAMLVGVWLQHRHLAATFLVALGLSIFTFSGSIQYLGLAYGVVCWQTWVLAARLEHRRAAVLAGIIGASLLGQFLILLHPTAAYSGLIDYWKDAPAETFSTLGAMGAFTSVSIGFFWLLGNASRRRTQRLEDLRARAELAALTERGRIAREMHDIVAHSLTAVIAQADGGRFAAAQHPEKATEVLATISRESRKALAEMRSLLSILHEEDRSNDIAPGSEQIAALVKEAERNGLRVSFNQEGTSQQLSESKSLTLYRIVQECLTNAIKHAGAVEATLLIQWEDRITVTMDNAPGQGLGGLPDDFGRGLIGIRERARIHGGDARWGASKSYPGGWKVQAWLMG